MLRLTSRIVGIVIVVLAVARGGGVSAQRAPIPQQLTFTPYRAGGVYDVGDTVGWTVTPGPVTPTYAYKWTIRRNNAVVLKEGRLDLSGGKASIEIVADQPSMLYVAVEAYDDLAPTAAPAGAGEPRFTGGNTGRGYGSLCGRRRDHALADRTVDAAPTDFDAFWDSRLASQAAVPMNPLLTPVDATVPGVDLRMFELDALGSKAHGYVGEAGEGRQVSGGRSAAVRGRVHLERARGGAARQRRVADPQRRLARQAAVGPVGKRAAQLPGDGQHQPRHLVTPEHVPCATRECWTIC